MEIIQSTGRRSEHHLQSLHTVAVVMQALLLMQGVAAARDFAFVPGDDLAYPTYGMGSRAVADIDGDGFDDILSASWDAGEYAVFFNRQYENAPHWDQWVLKRGVHGADVIMAADMDGDGDLDVLGAGYHEGKIRVFYNRLNEPTADFANSQVIVSDAYWLRWGKMEDLDNDGDLDILCLRSVPTATSWFDISNHVVDWIQNRLDEGDGFSEPIRLFDLRRQLGTTGTRSVYLLGDIHTGDFDGDGDLDVVFRDGLPVESGDMNIYHVQNEYADGGAGFNGQVRVLRTITRGDGLSVGDMDGDGLPDLVTTSYYGQSPQINLNRGGAQFDFANPVSFLTRSTASPFVADFNADGVPDIVYTNANTNSPNIVFLDNTDGLKFELQAELTAGTSSGYPFCVANINGDDWPDLVRFNEIDGTVWWDRNDEETTHGLFTLMPPITNKVLEEEGRPTVIDIDRDGKPEMIVTSPFYKGPCAIRRQPVLGSGPRYTDPMPLAPEATGPFGLKDFTGDGLPDLFSVPNAWTFALSINQPGKPGTFGPIQLVSVPSSNSQIVTSGAEDLDGDGLADLVMGLRFYYPDRYQLIWCRNLYDASGTVAFRYSPEILINASGTLLSLVFCDLDADGDRDIVAKETSKLLRVYENVSTDEGVEFKAIRTLSTGSISDLLVNDLNGDGADDFVAVTESSIDVFEWEGSSGELVLARVLSISGRFMIDAIDDFDSDGDSDIVLTRYEADYGCDFVENRLNQPEADLAPPRQIANGTVYLYGMLNPYCVSADMDSDGDPDLVTRKWLQEGYFVVYNEDAPLPTPTPWPTWFPPTQTMTSTPTPTLTQNPDHIVYTFDRGEEGWVFTGSPSFSPIDGGYSAAHSGLDIYSSFPSCFGFWENVPITMTEPSRYVVKATVSSNVADPAQVPTFRLRVSDADFRMTSEYLVNSMRTGDVAPTLSGRTFEQYLGIQLGQPMQFDFDLLNFLDDDAVIARMTLSEFEVTALGPTVPEDLITIKSWGPSQLPSFFEFRGDIPPFGKPIGEVTEKGLSIVGSSPPQTTDTIFGYWEAQHPGFHFEVGYVYRIWAQLATTASARDSYKLATFRLRLNAQSQQMAALTTIESTGVLNPQLPSINEDVMVELWFLAPPELAGEEPILSFDYLFVGEGTDNDPTLPLILRSFEVARAKVN